MTIHTSRALGAAAVWALASHTVVPAQQAVFRNGVELVPLTVTVTEASGKHVAGLAAGDFSVFEEGVQQPLTFFVAERVPVDVALVIDISGSMTKHLPLIKRAATGLVTSLHEGDRASLVAVARYAKIPQPLTAERASVARAVNGLAAAGDTALYDGLYIALRDLERARAGTIRKQAVVLLTDGFDTKSLISFEEAKGLALLLGVSIYVIAAPTEEWDVPTDTNMHRTQYQLRTLAVETGARLFSPRAMAELPDVSIAIVAELAHQYELGYLPATKSAARGFRRVSVRVANAIARTRAGYFASGSNQP